MSHTIRAYHRSGTSISKFCYSFTNQGRDALGSGFYFSDDLQQALSYTSATQEDLPKLGGFDNPTVHVADLTFERLLDWEEELPITLRQVFALIGRAPGLEDALQNWGDVDYEGREKVLARAADAYVHGKGDGPTLKTLNKIANDFYPSDVAQFNEALRDVLGIDGVCYRMPEFVHYVAFFPTQISILQRLTVEEARSMLEPSEPSRRPRQRQ
ncbi:hypothetical protein [Achromobacter insolitus]|uniref:hypothetical protein n=1 Tax=Achromobacter insolitus TaxID=217204 RepID=UPI003B9C9613